MKSENAGSTPNAPDWWTASTHAKGKLMTQHELHPLCTLFPRMAGAEFAALVADIKANGLRQPITLADGLILDGGNRYRACLEAGVTPKFSEFTGENLVTFVLSANLHRRHMTPGQQAAIVASAQDWAKAQPASRPTKACNVAPLSTAADRASQSGASLRTQKTADAVARKSPELSARVARGEISLPKAAKQIAPKPAKHTEPVAPADGDGPDLADLVDELQRENELLRAQIAASAADDLKAEAIKWRGAYEHAKREQGVAMDNSAKSQDREKFIVRMLRRCGKAVGIADPNHTDPRDIVKAVEAFVRGEGREANAA